MSVQTSKPRPVKYCADCQRVIAGPDTPVHVYNRIRYCPDCAKERTLYNKANFQKGFRRNHKERNRLKNEQIALLRKENAELRQRVDTLEKLNREARGYV